MQLLKQHFLSGAWATVVNGWRYPPANEGRFGDELLYRAADQSLAGIVANDPAEAVYLVNFSDDSGAKFSGDRRYELQFTGDNLPPVDAFWSLTIYAADYNLVANPANRYSIGDRTPGVANDANGGMTLYLQADSPGADKGNVHRSATSAERELPPGSIDPARLGSYPGRMLMARARTRMAITSDRVDWIIMVSLAHRRTGRVSVGLNAVALVYARYR
jgi:hypothetical protein